MEKRTKGITYLDSIDLEILKLLDSPNWHAGQDLIGWAVLDIVKKLGIKHNNLKPHLDKLLTLKLITIRDLTEWDTKKNDWSTNKKIGLASIRAVNNYWYENYAGGPEEAEEDWKRASIENERYNNIVKILEDIQTYFNDKENKKYLEIDLRKLETQEKLTKKPNWINVEDLPEWKRIHKKSKNKTTKK